MRTKRKSLPPVAFPAGHGQHTTFILGVRVWHTGRIEYTGLLRMPYSNRPKEGGGKSVPYYAINNKPYNPRWYRGKQPGKPGNVKL